MQNDHVSVDEAVALLLNLDFVPAPFTVLDLLEGFVLQAEEKYQRIPADADRQMERNSCHAAVMVCESRLNLGKVLVDAIESEIKRGNLIAKSTTSVVQYLSWLDIKNWAEDLFCLSVVERVDAPQKRSTSPGLKQHDGDQDIDSLDQYLATWGRTKAKNFLVTFYALVYNIAFSRQSIFLHADRSIKVHPLAEEIEGIVKKCAEQKSMNFQGLQAIKDRLEMAEKVWKKTIEGAGRSGK